MTPEQKQMIEELRALEAQATRGPAEEPFATKQQRYGIEVGVEWSEKAGGRRQSPILADNFYTMEDAQLFVAMRNNIISLLDLIEQQAAEIERLRKELREHALDELVKQGQEMGDYD